MDHGDMDMGHGGGQCVTNVRPILLYLKDQS